MGGRKGGTRNRRLYGTLFAMLLVLVVSAAIAMISTEAAPAPLHPEAAGDLGYTSSLVLFLIPVALLIEWFRRHRAVIDRHWTAFWITVVAIVALWSALDICLALTFFEFPDPDATLGLKVLGYDPGTGWGAVVPIEEFLFYISGSAFLVLVYIWYSERWFPEHTMAAAEYERAQDEQPLRKLFEPRVVLVGGVLVLMAVGLKAWDPLGSAVPGFPGYITFIVVMVVVPTAMFFRVILRFVNVPAMAFTLQSMLLIALLWEATLALPYGWWDYRHEQMVGIFITPWSNLPIEAVILWGAATWSNIAVYEVAKLVVHHRRRAPDQSPA
jgi:hypothetical protein